MKKYLYLILIPFIILQTGCSSYIELNNLTIIDAIGIEKKDNNYHFYVSYVEEIDQDSLEPTTKMIEIKGKNIPEVMNNLSLSLNKKVYLSHLNLLLINDSIKIPEIKNLISFFVNNQDTREDFLICYTSDIRSILENTKFQEINDLVRINEQETSQVIYTTMYDLIKNYYQEKPIYLTNIIQENTIKVNNLKIFKHNSYQDIDNNKSLFYNYLENNINTFNYNLECQDNKYLSLKILKSNTNNLNKDLIITNEIIIITNDCNFKKNNINKIFTNYLKDNLSSLTTKKIKINNTIRGNYESK